MNKLRKLIKDLDHFVFIASAINLIFYGFNSVKRRIIEVIGLPALPQLVASLSTV